MGWGRYLLMGDIGQQFDIRDTSRAVDDLRHQVGQAAAENVDQYQLISALQAEIRRLREFVYGLVELLETKGVVSQSELDAIATRPPPPPAP